MDFLIYSLKFIAGVAAVFTITTNISSIHNNLFTNEHLLEEYYDANYFTVKTTDFNAEKEEAFWNKLYKNEYNTLKPVICLNILNDKNDVILADEPTGSLDKKNSEIVMNILHELSEQGKTVIVVTHSEEIVAQEKHVLYL